MSKKFWFISVLVFTFTFSASLIANEWATYYFPDVVGSYWTYEDQDGEELTRYAIKPEEIEGETYRAFSYDPPLENWADFEPYVDPYFYKVDDDRIAFFVGTEIQNATKAVTTRQMEKAIPLMRQRIEESFPEGLNVSIDLTYDVEAESQDYFYLLPTPTSFDEEWTALEVQVVLSITMDFTGLPVEIPSGSVQTFKIYSSIVETGIVTDTETVETAAGRFEDCLRIEYWTDESNELALPALVAEVPSEIPEQKRTSVTTLWLAPNVGIVKFTHEHRQPEEETLEALGKLVPFEVDLPKKKTLELTAYEIKTVSLESE